MKKILVLLSIMLLGLLLVGCKVKEDLNIPLIPLEPSNPKEEEILEDDMITIEQDLIKGELVNVQVDVKNFTEIKIQFYGGGSYPIPFDLVNFKVDGVSVEYIGVENITGKNPLKNHWFKIGELDVLGNLVHNRKANLGLFDVNEQDEIGFISILVENIETFEFDFMVTTNAFQYFEKLTITRYVETDL